VRERVLPVAGKVNMHVNQRVNPTDVVAEATFAREHVLLDVARAFGISANAADKLIKVNEGDKLAQGALVAEKPGLFPQTIKTPRAGRVMVAGSGQVLMEVGDTRIELRAGLPGVVTQVIPDGCCHPHRRRAHPGRVGQRAHRQRPDGQPARKAGRCPAGGTAGCQPARLGHPGGQVRDLDTLKAAAELAGARPDPFEPALVADPVCLSNAISRSW
jgi:hypothetical protein